MKKYIFLLSLTLFVLSFILISDHFFRSKKARSLKNFDIPQFTEKNINNVSTMESPKILASKIPILMYHSISNLNTESGLFVSSKSFASQINYLIEKKYSFIDFEDLDKGDIPKNPIILTFDDGYQDFYTNAYPILKSNNVKATVFIITDYIGKQGYLNSKEIEYMNDLISFQSHTISHTDLRLLNEKQLETELKGSKETLEKVIKNKVIAISYPSGAFNSQVINIANEYYKYGVTTIAGTYDIENSKLKIPRIRVVRKDNTDSFAGMIIRQ